MNDSLKDLQNDLEEFLRTLPGDPVAHKQTAELLRKKGYSEQAIRDFLKENS
jgi:hypothetical protein